MSTEVPDELTDTERDMVFDDLAAILRALGLSDTARPYSAHEVVQRDILPAIEKIRADERRQTAEVARRIAAQLVSSHLSAYTLHWFADHLDETGIARGGDHSG